MEDRFNHGGTRYLDKDGRELTEQEYLKRQNAGAEPAESDDSEAVAPAETKKRGEK